MGISGGSAFQGKATKNTKALGQKIVGLFREHQGSSCSWSRTNEEVKRNRVEE